MPSRTDGNIFFVNPKNQAEDDKEDDWVINGEEVTQPAFTCSKLTIETLEQGVKYVQS